MAWNSSAGPSTVLSAAKVPRGLVLTESASGAMTPTLRNLTAPGDIINRKILIAAAEGDSDLDEQDYAMVYFDPNA